MPPFNRLTCRGGASEVDLIPFEINRLADPEAMPRHYQDQGCVSLPIAALPGCADELAQLLLCEVAPSIRGLHWRALTFAPGTQACLNLSHLNRPLSSLNNQLSSSTTLAIGS